MPDKIVNHFVLANGSIAKYDAGSLADLDETVSLAGYAPDAKAVGDRLTDVENLETRLSSGDEDDAGLHLDFYIDTDGDLCQVD